MWNVSWSKIETAFKITLGVQVAGGNSTILCRQAFTERRLINQLFFGNFLNSATTVVTRGNRCAPAYRGREVGHTIAWHEGTETHSQKQVCIHITVISQSLTPKKLERKYGFPKPMVQQPYDWASSSRQRYTSQWAVANQEAD